MAADLEEKLGSLENAGVSPALVAHIRDHIARMPDAAMYGISPFRLADEWGCSRQESLDAFLYGTRLGIFDLAWDVHCPSCKGIGEHVEHLAALKTAAYCEYCDLSFKAGFDDQVEVRFNVNENIRQTGEVDLADYLVYWDYAEETCRFTVPADGPWEMTLDLEPGTYYVKTVDALFGVPLVIQPPAAAGPQSFDLRYDGDSFLKEGTGFRHLGPLALRVHNLTDAPLEAAIIHRIEHPWVSAAHIVSNQSFRDLFSSELISPDETFSIRNQVFVFTDIRGSTALYERLGDSDAYSLVKEHFRILTDTVKAHHGAVVKTIGDAVMATFMVSRDAVEALFAMQEAFERFNMQENIRGEIIIKAGAHRGSCIAVNSNDRMDYFGRTVNIAARVQGLSTGQDITLSKSLYEEHDVKPLVDASGWTQRFIQAQLRGLQDTYDIVHLIPPDRTPA